MTIKFYLVGDTHGDLSFASKVMKAAVKDGVDTIYQLGDFGVWPGDDGKYYLDTLSETAGKRGVKWKVVLGNHEDYDQLDQIAGPETKGFNLRENIRIMGYKAGVWTHGDIKFACLGGAVSIDKEYRTPHRSWWPQELIGEGDLYSLERQMKEWNFDSVDVFLTHDAPNTMPIWSGFFKGDPLSNQSRNFISAAYEIARPRYGFHGHYHRDMTYECEHGFGTARVVGLGANPPAMPYWLDKEEHNSVRLAIWEDGRLITAVTNEWTTVK